MAIQDSRHGTVCIPGQSLPTVEITSCMNSIYTIPDNQCLLYYLTSIVTMNVRHSIYFGWNPALQLEYYIQTLNIIPST
jgi:hypothetical protein